MSRSGLIGLTLSLLIGAAILGVLAWQYYSPLEPDGTVIASFEACAAAGYPVMESYPAQCRTPDGRTFVQVVTTSSPVIPPHPLIRVSAPQPGQIVDDPLIITGQARGTWFFEATFPVRLTTLDGTILATGFAQADGEWMTEDFVPFRAEVDVPEASNGPAIIILEKDNPSGLPEHADSLSFPIMIQRYGPEDAAPDTPN